MKVPNKISTLYELAEWFDSFGMDDTGCVNLNFIEISKESKLLEIESGDVLGGFNGEGRWKYYRGIKIKYENN